MSKRLQSIKGSADEARFHGMSADEAAAEWDVRLRSPACTEEVREEFRRWRDAAPENNQAFEALQDWLREMRDHKSAPELRSLRDAAVGYAQRKRGGRWLARGAALAASLVLAVGAALFLADETSPDRIAEAFAPVHMDAPPFFATAVGERSTVTLDDGTIATLNTDTRLRVDYADAARRVTLLNGQALFDVAKDPDRPFIVAAGDQRITAVGTIFDVKFLNDEVAVTMLEGEVDVIDAASFDGPDRNLSRLTGEGDPAAPARLIAGQQLIAAASIAAASRPDGVVIRRTDPERAAIWREGRVFFENTSLVDAVAEMNRYSTTRIIAEDPALERYRINGMFFTGKQTNFVAAIEGYFPLEAKRRADGAIVIELSRDG